MTMSNDQSQTPPVKLTALTLDTAGKTFCYTLRGVHLGDDQDGDAITSCVVQPTEDSASPKQKRLSPAQRRALESFIMAKHRAGLGDDLSAGIDVEVWRTVFYEMSTADDQATKKRTFLRNRNELVLSGDLSVSDNLYRLARVPE